MEIHTTTGKDRKGWDGVPTTLNRCDDCGHGKTNHIYIRSVKQWVCSGTIDHPEHDWARLPCRCKEYKYDDKKDRIEKYYKDGNIMKLAERKENMLKAARDMNFTETRVFFDRNSDGEGYILFVSGVIV